VQVRSAHERRGNRPCRGKHELAQPAGPFARHGGTVEVRLHGDECEEEIGVEPIVSRGRDDLGGQLSPVSRVLSERTELLQELIGDRLVAYGLPF
jgi:hypothetical protein